MTRHVAGEKSRHPLAPVTAALRGSFISVREGLEALLVTVVTFLDKVGRSKALPRVGHMVSLSAEDVLSMRPGRALAVLYALGAAGPNADRIPLLKPRRIFADGAREAVLQIRFAFPLRRLLPPYPGNGRPLVVAAP